MSSLTALFYTTSRWRRTVLALLLAVLAHVVTALCSGRWSATEREFPLKSGDRMILRIEQRAGGRTERIYFIRWRDTGKREQILHIFGVDRAGEIAVVRNRDYRVLVQHSAIQWRHEAGKPGEWSYAYTTESRPIFSYLKSYLDRRWPGSYTTRSDFLLFLPADPPHSGPEIVLRDEMSADVPYRFSEIDFSARHIVWARTLEHRCLPAKLIFSEQGRFGQWKFDPAKTDVVNMVLP